MKCCEKCPIHYKRQEYWARVECKSCEAYLNCQCHQKPQSWLDEFNEDFCESSWTIKRGIEPLTTYQAVNIRSFISHKIEKAKQEGAMAVIKEIPDVKDCYARGEHCACSDAANDLSNLKKELKSKFGREI